MSEKRNAFGFPIEEQNLYRPLRDEPVLIEMFDQEPLLPAWVLWGGVAVLVLLAAYACVPR